MRDPPAALPRGRSCEASDLAFAQSRLLCEPPEMCPVAERLHSAVLYLDAHVKARRNAGPYRIPAIPLLVSCTYIRTKAPFIPVIGVPGIIASPAISHL